MVGHPTSINPSKTKEFQAQTQASPVLSEALFSGERRLQQVENRN